MANFPTSLDTLSNPTGTDTTENSNPLLDHDYQHSTANDILEALEAKVGVNSSAVTTSFDYKLGEVTSTDKAVGKSATQTLTNKTIDAASNTLVGVATSTSTTTFTNKRITARVSTSTADAAEPTLNTDNYDMLVITGQTNNITSMTTNLSGTPTEGQTLWLAMTAGSGTPTVTWGSGFEASSLSLPTGLTVQRQDFKFIRNTTTSKWRFVGYA